VSSVLIIVWLGAAIAVAVFATMIYSVISFRKSPGANPATFVYSQAREIIWAFVPIAILSGVAILALSALKFVNDG
jgi:cytochrome c oxidase subunit 2